MSLTGPATEEWWGRDQSAEVWIIKREVKKYGIITLKKFDYEKEGKKTTGHSVKEWNGKTQCERMIFFKMEKISPCLNNMYAQ